MTSQIPLFGINTNIWPYNIVCTVYYRHDWISYHVFPVGVLKIGVCVCVCKREGGGRQFYSVSVYTGNCQCKCACMIMSWCVHVYLCVKDKVHFL